MRRKLLPLAIATVLACVTAATGLAAGSTEVEHFSATFPDDVCGFSGTTAVTRTSVFRDTSNGTYFGDSGRECQPSADLRGRANAQVRAGSDALEIRKKLPAIRRVAGDAPMDPVSGNDDSAGRRCRDQRRAAGAEGPETLAVDYSHARLPRARWRRPLRALLRGARRRGS